jgi:polyhydroxyalkanoate synthesis regulator phasin
MSGLEWVVIGLAGLLTLSTGSHISNRQVKELASRTEEVERLGVVRATKDSIDVLNTQIQELTDKYKLECQTLIAKRDSFELEIGKTVSILATQAADIHDDSPTPYTEVHRDYAIDIAKDLKAPVMSSEDAWSQSVMDRQRMTIAALAQKVDSLKDALRATEAKEAIVRDKLAVKNEDYSKEFARAEAAAEDASQKAESLAATVEERNGLKGRIVNAAAEVKQYFQWIIVIGGFAALLVFGTGILEFLRRRLAGHRDSYRAAIRQFAAMSPAGNEELLQALQDQKLNLVAGEQVLQKNISAASVPPDDGPPPLPAGG